MQVSLFAKKENKKSYFTPGPFKADLKNIADIKVPKNYIFANAENARKLMQLYGNQPTNRELGYIAPKSEKWYIIFEFSETGYVKDDEKDKLDHEKILDSFREGTNAANEQRKEQGIPPLNIIGWHTKPHYNSKTKNIEWAILAESEGKKIVNYNIRYLGRKGVMEIILVVDPLALDDAVKKTKDLLGNYAFKSGNKYSEFVDGDKVAKYGLTALVTGGAIAVAAKSGLLGKLWKFLVVGFLAIAGFIKKFFKSLFGKEDRSILNKNSENSEK